MEKKSKKMRFETAKNNKQVKTQESNETSRQWQQETQEPMEKTQVTMERGLHTQLDQKGVQPPRWPYPGTWAGGSNPLADPTPGPGWGDPGRRRGQKSIFFFFPPRKKTKKIIKKKTRFGRTPPSRRGGPPKFPATFTTFPDGAAKSAKFPPNLAKVHVPRRLVTIRGILFHLQAPKVGRHSQRKRLQVFFCCFFPIAFFCFVFLFYCFVLCFFCFFQNG